MDSAAWLAGDQVAPIVGAARVARLVVGTRGGPLASAQLVAVADGRVWLVAARGSTRVRVLRRRPECGLVLRHGARSVIITGEAQVQELWGPRAALRAAVAAPAIARALLDYGTRHALRLAAFPTELARIPPPLEALPFDRVLVAVTPHRGAVWTGSQVVAVAGAWPGQVESNPVVVSLPAPPVRIRPGVPSSVPRAAAALADHPEPAVVGWETPDGPLALPARWDPHAWRAEIPAQLLALATPGIRAARACIALDRSLALRPSSYAGLVLRGTGRLEAPTGGGDPRLGVQVTRVSYWDGFATGTVEVPTPRVARPRRPASPRVRRPVRHGAAR